MRLRTFLVTVLAAASIQAFADQAYVVGTLSVKIAPGKASAADTALKSVGATVYRDLSVIGWKVVRLPKNASVTSVMNTLKGKSAFSAVELNGIKQIDSDVNDPMFAQQWGLTKMQLPLAWDVSKGSTGVIVAVIDTGIDRGHPDLAGRVLPGYDFINNDADPDDDNGHGTHCAGLVGASTNNGIGVASAGYDVTILPVKAATAGGGLPEDAIVSSILYAANNGAQVISMSFGGSFASQMENDAVQYAYGKKILLIAAAGNANTTSLHYPAAYPNVLAVASSDPDDSRSGFSNYGANWVHVAAPGSDILSTFPRTLGDKSGYAFESGTSMATPNVAGVAALLMSYAGPGTLTGDEVRGILQDSADTVPGAYVKYGRVNAFKAIQLIGTKVTDAAVPSTPTPVDGTVVGADSGQPIFATEGISIKLNGVKKSGVGLTGSFRTGSTLTQMTYDELKTATLTVNASGDKKATLQLFLYDASTGKWVLNSAKPMTTTTSKSVFVFSKTNLNKYMEGTTLRYMIRVLVPVAFASSSTGVTTIDQASVTFSGIRKLGATP